MKYTRISIDICTAMTYNKGRKRGIKGMKKQTTKNHELELFKSCLHDFWGEEPTKRAILAAWRDCLDCVSEDYEVEESWYKLSKEEKEELYKVAGV